MSSGDGPGLQNRRAAGLPVAGAFDSHTLPPFINNLRGLRALLRAVKREIGNFRLRFLHFVGHDIAVRCSGSDVSMTHHLLLNAERVVLSVEPTAKAVPHRVCAEDLGGIEFDSGGGSRLPKLSPHLIITPRLTTDLHW